MQTTNEPFDNRHLREDSVSRSLDVAHPTRAHPSQRASEGRWHTGRMSDLGTEHSDITVYWRPGCGYCSGLFRQLDRLQVSYAKVDIWQEPEGAAFVRSVARGSETVPTVAIGSVALVNPSAMQVLDVAATHAPSALPRDSSAR